jgi:hypothetical protein
MRQRALQAQDLILELIVQRLETVDVEAARIE